ncbi:hypothetical protein [Crateriforma spongiae]|uniref:hypothetical protein n=1 Tax=Crateriforma spongiae TaxID=2724528 RepID=UPI0039B08368
MLWPVILPFQITCGVMLIVMLGYTAFPYPTKLTRPKAFLLGFAFSLVTFIPSCTGIMMAVDTVRFGDFHYNSYDDVPDFRSRRYLPENATDIHMHKHANGYYARYTLPEHEFVSYLDELWSKYGEHSAVERGGFMDEGQAVNCEMFDLRFGHIGWDCPEGSVVYYSPSEPDGGGATYYVGPDSTSVTQRTGFW